MHNTVAGTGLGVRAERYGGPKVGGPIPDQQYALYIIGVTLGVIGGIVTLAEFAAIVRKAIAKARELTKNDVGMSNGTAVILAADAIIESTGERDLTFAFETPMTRYLPDLEEFDSSFDGWLIGFRSRDKLHVVHVDFLGNVTLTGVDVEVDWQVA